MVATLDKQAVESELARLREIYRFDDESEGSNLRRNGRTLSWRELAELNVERAELAESNVRDIVRAGKAPGGKTDREFFAGVKTLRDQLEERGEDVDRLVAKAKKRGYTPSASDFYQEGLDDAQGGNPAAFISMAGGGRAAMRDELNRRGLPCRGMVETKGRKDKPPPQAVPLSEPIIKRMMRKAIQKNPDLARMSKKRLREQIIDRHGARTKK